MNLILLQPSDFEGDRAVLTDHRARHILDVLGTSPGDTVRVGVLNGPLGTGTVEAAAAGKVVLVCELCKEPPPRPRVDLLLAMPRPKVMKRLWAQLAALGVGRIVLLRADKVERYYFDSHVLDPAVYNTLLVEGLQQARCTHLPEVLVRPLFKPFIEDELDEMFPESFRLAADPSGDRTLGDLLSSSVSGKRILLAVGPEGGWTPFEMDKMKEYGFQIASMGQRILRTDTAVISMIARVNEYIR